MKEKKVLLVLAFVIVLLGILWEYIPLVGLRFTFIMFGAGVFGLVIFWDCRQQYQQFDFVNDICETVDALIDGRNLENYKPYEDTITSKVQEKLLQYYDMMREGQHKSEQDKQAIQELVSDISHQVKTPVANIKMFADILQQHELSDEKRAEFLSTMIVQIDKLDFLMQSFIKMSRLETGIFTLHMEDCSLYDTIAQAVNGIWAKAEKKKIQIVVECKNDIVVRHDTKWTAEALGNILDNGIKYTPEGGAIRVSVHPWQFYTRIDISDTGIGIAEEHYHDVFKRFYRAREVASQEGVGLGLYLARNIITWQKGYISVKSNVGKGTTFSVCLLN